MNNQNLNFEAIAAKSNGKLNQKALENAAKSGNADALVKNLSEKEKEKLNQILSDKSELARLLKSPQAQMLLKMLSGGKNG